MRITFNPPFTTNMLVCVQISQPINQF